MAYAAANGTCPADHPVSLPEVTFEIDFNGIAGGPDYYLASGGIYSFHGDFMADWDNRVQNALVASCLNVPHDCAAIARDRNTLFVGNPDPVTINLNNFPATSPYDNQSLQGPVTSPPTSTSAPTSTSSSAAMPMAMPMAKPLTCQCACQCCC